MPRASSTCAFRRGRSSTGKFGDDLEPLDRTLGGRYRRMATGLAYVIPLP